MEAVNSLTLEAAFEEFDQDHSGYILCLKLRSIDRNEFRDLVEKLGGFLTDDELDKALIELDKDNSGAIDYDEFRDWWTKDYSFNSELKRIAELGKKKYHKDIFISCWKGNRNEVERFLNNGININTEDTSIYGCGYTPLMYATYKGQEDLVSFLLENEAKISARNSDGCNSFFIACQQNHANIVALFLNALSDTEKEKIIWDSTNIYNMCSIHVAGSDVYQLFQEYCVFITTPPKVQLIYQTMKGITFRITATILDKEYFDSCRISLMDESGSKVVKSIDVHFSRFKPTESNFVGIFTFDYEFLDIKQCVTYSVSTYFYDHLYTNIQTEEIRLTGSNCCLLCPPLKPHLEITRRKAEEPNKIDHIVRWTYNHCHCGLVSCIILEFKTYKDPSYTVREISKDQNAFVIKNIEIYRTLVAKLQNKAGCSPYSEEEKSLYLESDAEGFPVQELTSVEIREHLNADEVEE